MAKKLEYKFLVPTNRLDSLRADIKPFVKLDPFAEKGDANEYTVRSIYFDTSGLECFSEKIEGIKIRKKFRLRGYNTKSDESVLFWEIKRKYNNYIDKNRAPFLYKNLESVIGDKKLKKGIISSGNGKEVADAKRFLYNYYRKGLRPVVLVIYDREAFHSKFDPSFRVTFDKNLRSSLLPSIKDLYNNNHIKFGMPGYFIFEVKFFRGMPSWIINILKKYELNRRALSKYTICLDSHKAPKIFSQIMFQEFKY